MRNRFCSKINSDVRTVVLNTKTEGVATFQHPGDYSATTRLTEFIFCGL